MYVVEWLTSETKVVKEIENEEVEIKIGLIDENVWN